MYKVYNSYVNEYPSVHVYTVYKIFVVTVTTHKLSTE